MKTHRIHLILAALCALPGFLASQTITTGVPGFISYQGRVFNNTGGLVGSPTPVNRTVIFRVWDHPSNTLTGNLIYSEQQTVTIAEGEFSVLVGQGVATTGSQFGYSETAKKLADIATAFGGSTRYLGVTVDDGTAAVDNEITPRQQIVSSAFSFRAKFAETLGTSASTALTVLDNGNTGVGNTNPPSRFTVTAAGTGTGSPQMVITADDVTERLRIGVDSTGTGTGYIQSFKEGTGAQNLLLNPNGGNVGIGTATPKHKLDVNGNIFLGTAANGANFTALGDTLYLGSSRKFLSSLLGTAVDGSQDWVNLMCHTGSSGILFGGSGADATPHVSPTPYMVIRPTGRVGIGQTNPGSSLEVLGGVRARGGVPGVSGSNNNGYAFNGGGGDTDSGMFSTADGLLQFFTDSHERMRINSSGNVGIGTTTPGHRLHVEGGSVVMSATGASDNLGYGIHNNAGAERAVLGVAGGSGAYSTSAALGDAILRASTGKLLLQSGSGASAITISSSNNVGMGTNFPNERLHLKGILRVERTDSTNHYNILIDSFDSLRFQCNLNGGNYAYLNSNSFGLISTSDRRVKKDIAPMQDCLARIMKLTPSTFRYNTADPGSPLNYGFIAQDVELQFPDIVQEREGLKRLASAAFEGINARAIQELKQEKDAEVKALIDENAELRDENSDLQARVAALEAKDKAREDKLAAIEKLLLAADKAAVQPVSLKKIAGGAE